MSVLSGSAGSLSQPTGQHYVSSQSVTVYRTTLRQQSVSHNQQDNTTSADGYSLQDSSQSVPIYRTTLRQQTVTAYRTALRQQSVSHSLQENTTSADGYSLHDNTTSAFTSYRTVLRQQSVSHSLQDNTTSAVSQWQPTGQQAPSGWDRESPCQTALGYGGAV